jgi:hypothetical protein
MKVETFHLSTGYSCHKRFSLCGEKDYLAGILTKDYKDGSRHVDTWRIVCETCDQIFQSGKTGGIYRCDGRLF